MRLSTSVKHACGSTPFSLAVSISVPAIAADLIASWPGLGHNLPVIVRKTRQLDTQKQPFIHRNEGSAAVPPKAAEGTTAALGQQEKCTQVDHRIAKLLLTAKISHGQKEAGAQCAMGCN